MEKYTVKYTETTSNPLGNRFVKSLIMLFGIVIFLFFFVISFPFIPVEFKAIFIGHPIILLTVIFIPIMIYFTLQISFWLTEKTIKANLTISFNGIEIHTKKKVIKLNWFKINHIFIENKLRLDTHEGLKWIKFKYDYERMKALEKIKNELKILDQSNKLE